MTALDLGDKFVINITGVNELKEIFEKVGSNAMTQFDINSISLSNLPNNSNLFSGFGTRDCKIYVKDTNSKNWLEGKNNGYWTNNDNIIVGKMN